MILTDEIDPGVGYILIRSDGVTIRAVMMATQVDGMTASRARRPRNLYEMPPNRVCRIRARRRGDYMTQGWRSANGGN